VSTLTQTGTQTNQQDGAAPGALPDAAIGVARPKRRPREAGHDSRGGKPPSHPAVSASGDGDGHPRKRLSQLLSAARPYFLAVEVDDERHVARGIIPCSLEPAHVATISFEPKSRRLRIYARLGDDRTPTELRLQAYVQVTGCTGLVHVWRDPEDGAVSLWGETHSGSLNDEAAGAIAALAVCAFRKLQDDRVRALLREILTQATTSGKRETRP
jgi:hypothetical protein